LEKNAVMSGFLGYAYAMAGSREALKILMSSWKNPRTSTFLLRIALTIPV